MSGAAFRKYAADLARVANKLEPMAARRALKVAESAAAMAQSVAPVETGALKGGIEAERLKGGAVAVNADVHYAYFQEYGTSKMAPNPFMGPAVDRWGPKLFTEVEDMVEDFTQRGTRPEKKERRRLCRVSRALNEISGTNLTDFKASWGL